MRCVTALFVLAFFSVWSIAWGQTPAEEQAKAAIAIAKAKQKTPMGKAAQCNLTYDEAVKEAVKLRRPIVLFVGEPCRNPSDLIDHDAIPVMVQSYDGDKNKDPKEKRILIMSPGDGSTSSRNKDSVYLRRPLPADAKLQTILDAAEKAREAMEGIAAESNDISISDPDFYMADPDQYIGFILAAPPRQWSDPECPNGNCPLRQSMSVPRTLMKGSCGCGSADCICNGAAGTTTVAPPVHFYGHSYGNGVYGDDDGNTVDLSQGGGGRFKGFFKKLFPRMAAIRESRAARRGGGCN